MPEKLLEINNLHVDYETDLETVHALNGISFSLNKGETIGLVGETGAGKTTASLSILRLLPERTGRIKRGEIQYAGKDVLALSEHEMRSLRGKEISMIFQDPMTSLNPVMTVAEQIFEALYNHNSSSSAEELEKRVDDTLQLVGIPAERKHEYPHQFSGGMKQRVIIAIALCCDPQLLIADEPTTALDVTIQAQVIAMMKELQERLGTGMIMITHDLGIVAETCDKVAVMYAGEIIESGSLEEIFTDKNHHPYTVGLFGSLPNMAKNSRRLNPIPGLMPDPTDLPVGCYFSPRCPHCTEACRKEHPQSTFLSGSHFIRCRLFEPACGGAHSGKEE